MAKHNFELTYGSKAQVWHGTAYKTSPNGNTKAGLMKRKGRIVSRKKHAAGVRAMKKNKRFMAKPFKKGGRKKKRK